MSYKNDSSQYNPFCGFDQYFAHFFDYEIAFRANSSNNSNVFQKTFRFFYGLIAKKSIMIK